MSLNEYNPVYDFHAVNGGEDDLPLYYIKNKPHIISKEIIFIGAVVVFCCLMVSGFMIYICKQYFG